MWEHEEEERRREDNYYVILTFVSTWRWWMLRTALLQRIQLTSCNLLVNTSLSLSLVVFPPPPYLPFCTSSLFHTSICLPSSHPSLLLSPFSALGTSNVVVNNARCHGDTASISLTSVGGVSHSSFHLSLSFLIPSFPSFILSLSLSTSCDLLSK